MAAVPPARLDAPVFTSSSTTPGTAPLFAPGPVAPPENIRPGGPRPPGTDPGATASATSLPIDPMTSCFQLIPGARSLGACMSCLTADWTAPPQRKVYSNGTVEIVGSPGSINKMSGWLDKLGATRTGQKIFASLREAGGAPVRIVHWDAPSIKVAGLDNPFVKATMNSWACWCESKEAVDNSYAVKWSAKEHWLAPGRGVPRGKVFVSWDFPRICLNQEDDDRMPGPAMIGHELVHAIHAIRGEWLAKYQSADPNMWSMEEARTIGCRVERYENEEVSENAIRNELGAPRLTTHTYGPGLWDTKPWTRLDGTGPLDSQLWTLQQRELAAGRESVLPLHLQQQADDDALLQMTPPAPKD